MLDLVEEALDQIAVFVERGIEGSPLRGCGSARDNGLGTAGGDGSHGTPTVIALVGQDMICPQPIEQSLDLGDVVALSASQDEAHRVAQSIGRGVDLGA